MEIFQIKKVESRLQEKSPKIFASKLQETPPLFFQIFLNFFKQNILKAFTDTYHRFFLKNRRKRGICSVTF